MKTKTFDCVEMKRRGAERVRQRLAGMTIEQEIEYWRQRSEQFQRDQERLQSQTGDASAPTSTRK
ncbi:MAG: hypothetical protein ACUVXJ_09865 [Phycisphaerae bacterium]